MTDRVYSVKTITPGDLLLAEAVEPCLKLIVSTSDQICYLWTLLSDPTSHSHCSKWVGLTACLRLITHTHKARDNMSDHRSGDLDRSHFTMKLANAPGNLLSADTVMPCLKLIISSDDRACYLWTMLNDPTSHCVIDSKPGFTAGRVLISQSAGQHD